MNSLKTEVDLVLSKYKSIKDRSELIYLLNKEFDKKYSEDDLLNLEIEMTNLEIDSRIIDYYGYFRNHSISY